MSKLKHYFSFISKNSSKKADKKEKTKTQQEENSETNNHTDPHVKPPNHQTDIVISDIKTHNEANIRDDLSSSSFLQSQNDCSLASLACVISPASPHTPYTPTSPKERTLFFGDDYNEFVDSIKKGEGRVQKTTDEIVDNVYERRKVIENSSCLDVIFEKSGENGFFDENENEKKDDDTEDMNLFDSVCLTKQEKLKLDCKNLNDIYEKHHNQNNILNSEVLPNLKAATINNCFFNKKRFTDGYIHLNTCLSGNVLKPPLPEKSHDMKAYDSDPVSGEESNKESRSREEEVRRIINLEKQRSLENQQKLFETCHSSLPRKKVKNPVSLRNLRGTSENILNAVVMPPKNGANKPSFITAPPPLPAKKLFRNKYNSLIEDYDGEIYNKNKPSCVRSSSSEQPQTIYDIYNDKPCDNIKKPYLKNNAKSNTFSHNFLVYPSNSLPKAHHKLKKEPLSTDRMSMFCTRDSDGYLLCDQKNSIMDTINVKSSLYNKALTGEKSSLTKLTNDLNYLQNKTPHKHQSKIPDSSKLSEMPKFKKRGSRDENIAKLLSTSVPLPKKNISRFYSHSNSRPNNKQTPLPRSCTYDCSDAGPRCGKTLKESQSFEVSYLQLDMVSPGSSPHSSNIHRPLNSNYKEIDWDKTKALTDLRFNRINAQELSQANH